MTTWRRYSLVWRLLLLVGVAYLVTAATVFLLLDDVVHHVVERTAREEQARRLPVLVRTLERAAARAAAEEEVGQSAALGDFAALHAVEPGRAIVPFVLDEEGVVLLHPELRPGARVPGLPPAPGPAPTEVFFTAEDGTPQWAVMARATSWNWTVGYQAPRAALSAGAGVIAKRMMLAWIGVALLVGAILIVALQRLTRPLLELADAARAMTDGDLEREVDGDQPGEIGTLSRSFVSMRDAIRHQMEELRESESRYRCIFDAMADVLLLLDQDGVIVAANPRAAGSYGWSPARLTGRPIASLLRAEDHELARALRTPPADRPLTLSGITCDREGHELETEIGAVRLEFQGAPHALVILRVVAEQRRLERQLMEAQKLESVGRLAGGIAHDFNNLLTPVLGYTEMLLDNEDLDAEARSDVAAIRRAGERARHLARQLLAFSRRQVLEMVDLDLDSILRDLEPILRRTLREDIELELRPGCDEQRIRGDVNQIEQIIMNLAINAMDAMPDGGRIEIETGRCRIAREDLSAHPELAPGDYLSLVVRDTGHGVPPEILDRVVEPFFTTKDAGKGTGLGLATIHGIVQQYGGELRVCNRQEGGCEVTLLLPALPELDGDREASLEEQADVLRGDGEVVVLVEDDDMVRELVERLLVKHGYTVRSFADGKACLRDLSAEPEPADILVTDVIMPGLSGPELRDRLHAAGLMLPALFMSGYTGDTLLRRGLADARADFLQKPVMPEHLLRKLRGVLSGLEAS
jgi:PAS domain S-box-containing protein